MHVSGELGEHTFFKGMKPDRKIVRMAENSVQGEWTFDEPQSDLMDANQEVPMM